MKRDPRALPPVIAMTLASLILSAGLALPACGDDVASGTDALADATRHDGGTDSSRADSSRADGPHDISLTDGPPRSDQRLQDAAKDTGPIADTLRQDSKPADLPPPDTNPVPAVPVLPHKTDFLNVGCRTHTYAGLDAAKRKACRDAIKKRGYTHFYLYAYNEKDYGGPAFDYYANAAGFSKLLRELIADGLAPVVWLFPDDAPTIAKTSTAKLKKKLSALVPAIDPLVSSYVLGLELDEYWPAAKVDSLGKHLRTLTKKKIAVHQLNGKWSFGKYPWVDYMVLQYGFGLSASKIRSMTQKAISDLKKPVVAGEYALNDEAKGKLLGDVAVKAGASGFGNGGTP